MFKIVCDDKIPYIQPALRQLTDRLVLKPGQEIGPDDVRDAQFLVVRTRTRCDEHLLGGSSVLLVATATIGYDHLDTQWLSSHGIAWSNSPGCNASSVGQYVSCSLLQLKRRRGVDLSRSTLGVVGVGHVGTAVLKAVQPLGLKNILLCDPPKEAAGEAAPEGFAWSPLDRICREADIITFHTPLTHDGPAPTYHLADRRFFDALRPNPGRIIINAARGGVVDEQALLDAMDQGTVREAVIDTWEDEPDINPQLLRRAFVATPHIAGYSADGKANATRMSFEAVAGYLGLQVAFDVQPPAQTNAYGTAASSGIAVAPTTAPAAMLPRPGSILWHYDPRHDSTLLKRDASGFEWQRGHYPLRREA